MIRAYHFVGNRLRDGRPVPPDGEWLVHDGPIKMCESGLHASRHPSDALIYAPGPNLCLVDCDEIDAEDVDKLVCRRRRIVARFDATTMLRAFARQCALDVIHLWSAPQVVRDYLTTGDESLRAAAWDAARASAWKATKGDAKEAAWSAATSASPRRRHSRRSTPPGAAGAAVAAVWATKYAARNAAWDTARNAQRERFARLVADEFTKVKNTQR